LPISCISIILFEESTKKLIVAIGDDNGNIQIVLIRKFIGELLAVFSEHDDYISQLVFNESKKIIIAASGDGSISVYNFEKLKMIIHSDNLNNEIQSMIAIGSEGPIICGCNEGFIGIFKQEHWERTNSKIKRDHIEGDITFMTYQPSNDQTVLAGTSDGSVYSMDFQKSKPVKIYQFPDSIEKIEASGFPKLMFILCSNGKIYRFESGSQKETKKSNHHESFFNDLI